MPNGTFTTTDILDISALGYGSIDDGAFEELSDDGRYMTLLDGPTNTQVSVLDLATGTLRSTVQLQDDVDRVGVSGSGDYLAVQYVTRGIGSTSGLVIYDAASGAMVGHASDHYEHGDLGVDINGNDVFVTMGYTGSCAGGNVACYSVSELPDALEQGNRQDLFHMPPAVGSYTSCRAGGAGYCLNGDDYADHAGQYPFAREIWLTRLADGAVKRLAHHRSSSCVYFNGSRPSISPSGRYALFTSDWARPNCNDEADTYVIDLAPALGGWATAPSTPDAGARDASSPPDASSSPDATSSSDAGTKRIAPETPSWRGSSVLDRAALGRE